MPRYPRKSIQTPYLHVMTQGINKSYIFTKDEDIKYYIKNMYRFKDDYNIKIISYCIMSNHAHILFKVNNIDDLSKYMQRLNTKYGKYFNKKYNRVGFVFRNRYRAEGIFGEQHLYNCINYIYENPVKAGMCKKASEYLYSNYKKYDKKIENYNYSFLETDEDRERECKDFIKQYISKNGLDNEDNIKCLVGLLKDKYRISARQIAEYLNMNREKIRKILNQ